MNTRLALIVTGILGSFAGGCGVKGPPLPPVADTPQASDGPTMKNATSGAEAAPLPSPSPSPSPRTKAKKRR